MLRSAAPSSFFSTSVSVAICALGSSPMMDFLPTSSCSSRRHSSCCLNWSEICCARRASRDSGRCVQQEHGTMEEATLRAKIQAMKNLLEAKRERTSAASGGATQSYVRGGYVHYQPRNYASGPVNRSWNRFSPPPAAVNRSHAGNGSANKVWRREEPEKATNTPSTVKKTWKRPVKVAANTNKSMQLQVLKLEDGEYSKANGGFSLVRAGVKPTAVTRAKTAPIPVTHSNSYCKNKDECRFIHDSRRVAMCRKFLKNECSDPKCLLSHQHDKVEKSTNLLALVACVLLR
ncbi:hypothetical protein PHMEG_0001505 [Phytophthora megakarya]|uniref:C3H1-type domain-containing protein n=1 Tax=Phytophthora megakarya TaxID=4795 RepID=A0A225X2N5_9STRA|nr:hypothetical protein PHMEG_0001505 [Phytophthora megakarya]